MWGSDSPIPLSSLCVQYVSNDFKYKCPFCSHLPQNFLVVPTMVFSATVEAHHCCLKSPFHPCGDCFMLHAFPSCFMKPSYYKRKNVSLFWKMSMKLVVYATASEFDLRDVWISSQRSKIVRRLEKVISQEFQSHDFISLLCHFARQG